MRGGRLPAAFRGAAGQVPIAIVPRVPQVDTPPQEATGTAVKPDLRDFMIEVDGQLDPQLRRDDDLVQRGRRRDGQGRPHRQGRGPGRHRLQVRRASSRQNELSIRRSIDPAEEVQLGEEVDALVLTKEDQDGRLILSKKRARFERAWRRIEAAAESGEPVEGTVIEVVKGGLIIDLGVRGFLPASLVDIRRVQNLDEYLGQKIECKVIELNRSRNNVVLSRRAVLEEERKEARQQILDRLQRGEVVDGHDLEHRRLRRVRGPRRHRRPDPHLRAFVGPREPSVRGAVDRRDGERQGARHRPRPPAHLARSQADPGGPVGARRAHLQRRRRARGQGHQGGQLRRVRRDHGGRRGPGPHLRACAAPRREPARGRRARATT